MSQNVRKKPVKRRETYYEDEAYDEEAYEDSPYADEEYEDDGEEWEEVVIRRPRKRPAAGAPAGKRAPVKSPPAKSRSEAVKSGGPKASGNHTGQKSGGPKASGNHAGQKSGGPKVSGNHTGQKSGSRTSARPRPASAAHSSDGARKSAAGSAGKRSASQKSAAPARPAPRKRPSYYEEYDPYEEISYRTASDRKQSHAREQEDGGRLMGVVMAVTGVLVLAFACVAGYLLLQKNAVTAQREDIAAVGEQLTEVGDGGLSVLQSVAREQAAAVKQAEEEEAARLEEEQRQQEEEQARAEKEKAAAAVKKEETKAETQAPAEPALTDTVEFTEATTSETGSTVEYEEVSKDKVPDPGTKSKAAEFARLTSVTGVDIYSGGQCITGGAVYVNVGESVTLKAQVSPDNADDQRVEWESVDKSTATIDKNRGIVTGVKADDTIIIARSYDGSYEAKIWVKVRQGLKVTLNHNAVTVSVGGEAHLEARSEEGNGRVDVTWKNADSSVAKIDSDGTVTGKKEGKTTVTAVSKASGEVLDTCVVTVANNGIAVNLNKNKLNLNVGQSEQLKAEVWGTDDTGIRWHSTDSSVASVSTNGTVTAVKAGVITVIAYSNKDEDSYAYCDVYVGGTVGGTSPDPKKDTSTKLKDRDGNQLYVKDSKNNYVEATSADFYTHDKFYKRVEKISKKYTGWHNFQGKIYYFDKTGKIITGEQVIQGKKYVFGTDGILQEGTPPV